MIGSLAVLEGVGESTSSSSVVQGNSAPRGGDWLGDLQASTIAWLDEVIRLKCPTVVAAISWFIKFG